MSWFHNVGEYTETGTLYRPHNKTVAVAVSGKLATAVVAGEGLGTLTLVLPLAEQRHLRRVQESVLSQLRSLEGPFCTVLPCFDSDRLSAQIDLAKTKVHAPAALDAWQEVPQDLGVDALCSGSLHVERYCAVHVYLHAVTVGILATTLHWHVLSPEPVRLYATPVTESADYFPPPLTEWEHTADQAPEGAKTS